MVTVLCLVAPEPEFPAEAFQSFVSSETARIDSAISSANRVTNGAGGQSSMPGGITYAFSVKSILLPSPEIVRRSGVISSVLYVRRSGARLFRTTLGIVIYAMIV